MEIGIEGQGLVYDENYEGKHLADDPEALDALARAAGVRTLLSFLAEPASNWRVATETIRPSAWLATVRALLDQLAAGGKVGKGKRQEIQWSLTGLDRVLRQGAAEGRRWHLWLSC